MSVFDLANDFDEAVELMPQRHPRKWMLELIDEAIGRDLQFVDRHPTTLFQCLWNSCWWYDCPEAETYYGPPQDIGEVDIGLRLIYGVGGLLNWVWLYFVRHDGEAAWQTWEETKRFVRTGWKQPPPWEQSGARLCDVAQRWRQEKERGDPAWLRSLRPPHVRLGGGQRFVLHGNESLVKSIALSPAGDHIAACLADGSLQVWDAHTGEQRLRGRTSDDMRIAGGDHLSFAEDGSRLVAMSARSLEVWHAVTGAALPSKHEIAEDTTCLGSV